MINCWKLYFQLYIQKIGIYISVQHTTADGFFYSWLNQWHYYWEEKSDFSNVLLHTIKRVCCYSVELWKNFTFYIPNNAIGLDNTVVGWFWLKSKTSETRVMQVQMKQVLYSSESRGRPRGGGRICKTNKILPYKRKNSVVQGRRTIAPRHSILKSATVNMRR